MSVIVYSRYLGLLLVALLVTYDVVGITQSADS